MKIEVSRSVAKALTFRILVIISNGILVYLLTGEVKLVLSVVTLTTVINTLLYFLHERIWNKVDWGRNLKETYPTG